MSFIAAAVIAGTAAVVGGGMAYAGSRKNAKAAERASQRTAAAADKANQRELAWASAYHMGIPGINAFSSEEEIRNASETGGAFGKPIGPTTGAFPGYADKFTEQQDFEANQFGKMVSEYERASEFWDQFEGQQQSQMEWMQDLPQHRENIAKKGFEELGKMVMEQGDEMANFEEQKGLAMSSAINQQLGSANTNTVADGFRGFSGVGDGGTMQNQISANLMKYMPAAAAARLGGDQSAEMIRNRAEMSADPWTAGLYDKLVSQRVSDVATADNYGNSWLSNQYSPYTTFMNATRPFSPGRINAPDQTIPVFQSSRPGDALASFGSTIAGIGGQFLGNRMQLQGNKDLMQFQYDLNNPAPT